MIYEILQSFLLVCAAFFLGLAIGPSLAAVGWPLDLITAKKPIKATPAHVDPAVLADRLRSSPGAEVNTPVAPSVVATAPEPSKPDEEEAHEEPEMRPGLVIKAPPEPVAKFQPVVEPKPDAEPAPQQAAEPPTEPFAEPTISKPDDTYVSTGSGVVPEDERDPIARLQAAVSGIFAEFRPPPDDDQEDETPEDDSVSSDEQVMEHRDEASAAEEQTPEPEPAAPTAPPPPDAARASIADQHGTRPPAIEPPDREQADDLRRVKGIGPRYQATLKSLGIHQFMQIAAWTPDEVAWISYYLTGSDRLKREVWVSQAKILAVGSKAAWSIRTSDKRK